MVDRYGRVKLTNADKVLYPATDTAKGRTKATYSTTTSIAEVMLPHIAGRPATRKRWPNGVDQASFFEKQLASSAPDWLDRASITHRSGTTTYPIIDSVRHWPGSPSRPRWKCMCRSGGSSTRQPGPATRLVFDLDPGEDVTMRQLCEVARAVRT